MDVNSKNFIVKAKENLLKEEVNSSKLEKPQTYGRRYAYDGYDAQGKWQVSWSMPDGRKVHNPQEFFNESVVQRKGIVRIVEYMTYTVRKALKEYTK